MIDQETGEIIDGESTELVPAQPAPLVRRRGYDVSPVLTINALVERRQVVETVVAEVMEDGIDYGVIPGTNEPSLWKKGGEVLCTVFGLEPRYREIPDIDFTGERHNGEAFIGYTVSCTLFREGASVGSGSGSCSSWERKYRYAGQKGCPECGARAIYRSKNADGGWYCWGKKGGCGAQFGAEDPRIGTQGDGRDPNPDVFDLQNTILKMAQKRAFLAAVNVVTGADSVIARMARRRQGAQPPPQRGSGSARPAAPAPRGNKPEGCTCATKDHDPKAIRCALNKRPPDQAYCSSCGVAPLTEEQIRGSGMCPECEAKAAGQLALGDGMETGE